jgi:hypothetical protein
MKRALLPSLCFFCLAQGCSVKLITEPERASAANECKADADCGAGAACTKEHFCVATRGTIDDVLLEIIPDSASTVGGKSYLSAQPMVAGGGQARNVVLPGLTKIAGRVVMDGADPGSATTPCPYDRISKPASPTIAARIDFTRVASIGTVPVLGITPVVAEAATSPTMTDVATSSTFELSLVPSTYDVYVQPADLSTCSVPPRLLKNVVVPPGKVDPSAPPATLYLPAPVPLKGTVQRTGGTLVNWEVSVVDPDDGRTISTIARLGDTSPGLTNFLIRYQPVADMAAPGVNAIDRTGAAPLIRIAPPKDVEAPTVLWDLSVADIDGDGMVSLDMSGVPGAHELIAMSGQVQDDAGTGLPATVHFFSPSLAGSMGLVATYQRSVTTDASGHYDAKLFPGQYRVIAIPDSQLDSADPAQSSGSDWAITEGVWDVGKDALQARDLPLFRKRRIVGMAGGALGEPASGATLEAVPSLIPTTATVLRGALAQTPVLPQNASSSLDATGTFAMSLDPGTFDITLRAPSTSNYAWWVAPASSILAGPADKPLLLQNVQLAIPVPLEGRMIDPAGQPLRNAVVRAYAARGMAATEVGDARTDEMGRFTLWLPADFAKEPVVESSQ